MDKNPVLGAVVAAIFMVLSAVSFSGATDYFCYEYVNQNGGYYEFSQRDYSGTENHLTAAQNNGKECFKYWYDDNCSHSGADSVNCDAHSYMQAILDNKYVEFKIPSDIKFAGTIINGNDTTCNDNAPNAFKGKFLDLYWNDIVRSNSTLTEISGLCYISEKPNDEMGFVKIKQKTGRLEYLGFKDVYFKLNGSGDTKTGIVLFEYNDEYSFYINGVSSLDVDFSTFKAKYAGAISPYFPDNFKVERIGGINVNGVSVYGTSYAGAVVGYARNFKTIGSIEVNKTTVKSDEYAGAVFGYADIPDEFSINNLNSSYSLIRLYDNTVKGKYAGGIFGLLNLEGQSASFEKVTVGSFNVDKLLQNIDDYTTTLEGDCVGALVGKLEYDGSNATTTVSFNKNRVLVKGISYKNGGSQQSGGGGLVGYIHNTSPSSGKLELNINTNYVIGDVNCTSAQSDECGYLIGALDGMNGNGIVYNVTDNYHFGTNDKYAKVGIGGMSESSWLNSSAVNGSITRNFRNALCSNSSWCEPNGDLQYAAKPIKKNSSTSYDNGIIPESQMKNHLFASVLNKGTAIFTEVAGSYNSLPYFENITNTSLYDPVIYYYPVTLDMESFNEKADDNHKNVLQNSSRNLEYGGPDCESCIVLFTDDQGKLPSADVQFAKDLLSSDYDWDNASYQLNTTTDFSTANNPLFTYKSNGCLGDDQYFHLECSGGECHLSQGSQANPDPSTDFKCWYGTDGLKTALENGTNASSKIVLDTDLDLGGFDATSNECNVRVEPLGEDHNGFDGNNKTISGLCYVYDGVKSTESSFALFRGTKSGEFKNVTFDGVYIKANDDAAVLALTLYGDVNFLNVTINDAELWGKSIGTLAKEDYGSVDETISITGVSLNNVTLHGSVYNGGLVANLTDIELTISGVTINGLSVPSAATNGGIIASVGEVTHSSSWGSVHISDVSINGNMSASGGVVGGIVGEVVGMSLTIEKVGFTGDLSGRIVGGIVGYLEHYFQPAPGYDYAYPLVIKNTYTNGKILVNAGSGSGISSAGYIVGSLDYDGSAGGHAAHPLDQGDSLYNNYHFSITQDEAIDGVGNYAYQRSGESFINYTWTEGNYDNVNSSKGNQGNIFGNVRNAASVLAVSGELGYHVNVLNDQGVTSLYTDFFEGRLCSQNCSNSNLTRVANGIANEADMKSSLFAALMNYNLEIKGQPAIWISKNGNLPTFVTNTLDKPNHLVVVNVTDLNLTDEQKNSLPIKPQFTEKEFVAGTDPTLRGTKTGVVSSTDGSGYLSIAFESSVAKLLTFGKSNLNADVLLFDETDHLITSLDGPYDTYLMWKIEEKVEKFCIGEGTAYPQNGSSYPYLVLLQSPEVLSTYSCYDYWYNENAVHGNSASYPDAYSHIMSWLDALYEDSENVENARLEVNGDIHFAGRNDDGTCKDGKNAFKGKMLSLRFKDAVLRSGVTVEGISSTTPVISGLCYITDTETSVGFFSQLTGVPKNLAFDNVYFKSTAPNSNVGIISTGRLEVEQKNYSSSWSPLFLVTNSEFYGDAAGAVCGKCGFDLMFAAAENVKVYGKKYAGGLVGYYDGETYQVSTETMRRFSIRRSNVNAEISTEGAGSYAGGLVGYLEQSYGGNPVYLINDNYVLGNVKGKAGATLGYLVGGWNYGSHWSSYGQVLRNYHYGTDDASAKLGIGTFSDDEWRQPASGRSIQFNFRNAIDGLEADGDLRYHVATPVYDRNSTAKYPNGIVPGEQMKSKRLTVLLDRDPTPQGTRINGAGQYWVVREGQNEGLPRFRGDPRFGYANQLYMVTLDIDSFYDNADPSMHAKLDSILNDGIHTLEYIDDAHTYGGIILYTTGTTNYLLSDDDVKLANLLLYPGDSWSEGRNNGMFAASSTTRDEISSHAVATYKKVTKLFCFKQTNGELNLRQTIGSYSPSGETCFEYWYDDNADHTTGSPDAYSYAKNWLDVNMGSIVLTSNIQFAGKKINVDGSGTPTDTVCVDAPNAFKGKYLELGAGDAFTSETGKIDTISGLCYVDKSGNAGKLGFVYINAGTANLSNVAFSNVYFNLTENAGEAGVLSINGYESPNSIGKIYVEDSYFEAEYAGAIAGVGEFISISEPVVVKNVTVKGDQAGGVCGIMSYGSGSISGIAASYSNITVSGVTVIGYNAGGVFGKISTHDTEGSEQYYEHITVEGYIKGSQGSGGLVGGFGFMSGGLVSVQHVSFLGDVDGTYSGGIAGYIEDAYLTLQKVLIKNSYLKGSIKGGYLVGDVYPTIFDISDNYYYATNDASATFGIKSFSSDANTSFLVTDEWWHNPNYTTVSTAVGANGSGTIARNFRNTGFNYVVVPDGNLNYDPSTPIHGSGNYANGMISDEDMKTRRFAAVLNIGSTQGHEKWTITDGIFTPLENDGMPFFVNGSTYSAVYPVSFDLTDFNTNADANHQKKLQDSLGVTRQQEYISANNTGIVAFTDHAGVLDAADIAFVNSLGTWKDDMGNMLDPTRVYSDGSTVYRFDGQSTALTFFCFKENGNDLEFSQTTDDVAATSNGERCFGYWYDGTNNDAYSYAQN